MYGFINEKYEEVIPYKYYDAKSFSDGLAAVSNKKIEKLVQMLPRINKRDEYDYFDIDEEGNEIRTKGNYGFMDNLGRQVIPCKYDNASSFREGIAMVEQNDKQGYIDKSGNEIISLKYDFAEDFYEGLALVAINGKFGFINKYGVEYWED